MYDAIFEDFLAGEDTLRIYENAQLAFASKQDRLTAWMEYMEKPGFALRQAQCERASTRSERPATVVFDKVMGNAAALLAINAGCREVFSPLGSEIAATTLDAHGVRRHLTEIVPYIRRPDGLDMCPMEKLSLGRGPAEFYQLMRRMAGPTG